LQNLFESQPDDGLIVGDQYFELSHRLAPETARFGNLPEGRDAGSNHITGGRQLIDEKWGAGDLHGARRRD
jgi:hypothetical protein